MYEDLCGFFEYGQVTDTGTYALFAENMILQKLIIKSFLQIVLLSRGEIHQRKFHTKRVWW